MVNEKNQEILIRVGLPSDSKKLDELVTAHASQNPAYVPGEYEVVDHEASGRLFVSADGVGDKWLAGGNGPLLVRFVAEHPNDGMGGIAGTRIVGHIAIGGVTPGPARDLWIKSLKKNVTLVEIRRGVVHPDFIGTGIGGELTKVAFRWALERNYLPVAATLPGKTKSAEMINHYGWRVGAKYVNAEHGDVELWIPPQKIVDMF